MFPLKLGDNSEKLNWSHTDCFGDNLLEYISAFVHKNYTIGMHSHNFYEINIVLQGTGRHYIENQSCDVKKGYVFVIPPNIKHGYWQESSLDVYHILVSSAFFERYSYEFKNLPGFSIIFEIEPYLRGDYNDTLFPMLNDCQMNELQFALNDLLSVSQMNYTGKEIIKNAQTLYILGTLCHFTIRNNQNSMFSKKGSYSHSILQSMEYIRLHCSEKITIELLIKLSNLSRSTFLRYFEKMCKCAPMTYLLHCRIQKSKELIISTNLSMTEIAQECGFYDNSHFTKFFMKHEKINPTQFKITIFAKDRFLNEEN